MQVTVSDLQAYLAHHYGQHGNGNETALFMKLVEEIGEVAEILNQRAGRKANNQADLEKELATEIADIIHYAVALAAVNNLPLNDIILEKDKRAAVKYQHETDLETFLSKE